MPLAWRGRKFFISLHAPDFEPLVFIVKPDLVFVPIGLFHGNFARNPDRQTIQV